MPQNNIRYTHNGLANSEAYYKHGTSNGQNMDPNTTIYPRILTDVNTPQDRYYYIDTIFYAGIKDDGARNQIARGYISDDVYMRRCDYNGNWSSWVPLVMQTSGTWTPSFVCRDGGSSPTIRYSTRVGNYIKLGSMVYISFYARGGISNVATEFNYAAISGLPFSLPSLKMR